jgi:hypothetical protein
MIITEQKPVDGILRSLGNHRDVFLVGCPVCATTWGTGGKPQLAEMKERLERAGMHCAGLLMPDESTCDQRTTRLQLRRAREELSKADAVLVLACGAGVQTVAALVDLPTYPALNTLFLARLQSLTLADERCRLCGDCVLAETGGICPVALCPKGLANGPCGGYMNGKCEVDKEQDCAWVMIHQRLQDQGRGDLLHVIRKPRDWSRARHPRHVDKRILASGGSDGGGR